MSGTVLNEAEVVQNAALGCSLLWRFGHGYQERASSCPVPFPLAFIVLPICMSSRTLQLVTRTNRSSGLALFVAKLGEVREDLLAVHERALALRKLSLFSLATGVRTRLLTVNYDEATVRSNELKSPAIPERLREAWNAAEKLGHWCAGLQVKEVSTLLRVEF
jgi:hypothetical protein